MMTPLEKHHAQSPQGKCDRLVMVMFYAVFEKLCPDNDRAEEEVFQETDLVIARNAVIGLASLLLTYSLDRGEDMSEAFGEFVRDLRSMFLADGPGDDEFILH